MFFSTLIKRCQSMNVLHCSCQSCTQSDKRYRCLGAGTTSVSPTVPQGVFGTPGFNYVRARRPGWRPASEQYVCLGSALGDSSRGAIGNSYGARHQIFFSTHRHFSSLALLELKCSIWATISGDPQLQVSILDIVVGGPQK